MKNVSKSQRKSKRKHYLEDSSFVLRPDWKAKLADMILHDRRLSYGARICGGVTIIDHFHDTTKIYPSRETLAKYQGATVRSICEWFKELEDAAYYKFKRVIRGRRKDGSVVYGGTNEANIIFFPVELVRNAIKTDKQNNRLQRSEGKNIPLNEGSEKVKERQNQTLTESEGKNFPLSGGRNFPPYTNSRGTFASAAGPPPLSGDPPTAKASCLRLMTKLLQPTPTTS
jgi:hypothetical protein